MADLLPLSLTQKLIDEKPLPPHAHNDAMLTAQWLDNSILPSLARAYPDVKAEQPWEVTEVIIGYLRHRQRLSDTAIAAALFHSAYAFNFNGSGAATLYGGVILQMSLIKIKQQADRLKDLHASMRPEEIISMHEFSLRATNLELRYIANMHDPALQAEIIRMLVALVSLAMQSTKMWSSIKTARQKMEDIHRQVLASAPAASANIRTISSMELAVMRQAPMPNAPGTIYYVPPVSRPVRGR